MTFICFRICPTPTSTFELTPRKPVVPLTPASQPGPPTVICQGSVLLADGCSTNFDSSSVPAHPGMNGKKVKNIDTTLNLTGRFIVKGEQNGLIFGKR